MRDEIEAVGAILREAAARAVLPRFRRLAAHERREKEAGDVVTDADLEAERIIAEGLRRLSPDSLIVGEEAAAADPGLLDRAMTSEAVWVIDPVDGTANFAAGIPVFGLIVARIESGRTMAGWIYDPVNDLLAWARAGGGAWVGRSRLTVAAPVAPASMEGVIALRHGDRAFSGQLASRMNRVAPSLQFRCAAAEYLMLAAGRIHYALYRRLLPWDHAAGQLLHAEAGGHSAHLDGSAYAPLGGREGLLLAPDRASWEALHRTLIAP